MASPSLPRAGAMLRELSRRLPLPVALHALDAVARFAPTDGLGRRWAADELGLSGPALDLWCRRVWWGRRASDLVRAHFALGPDGERAIDEITIPIDWSTVDRALGERRGVLLVGAHVGVPGLLGHAVVRHRPDALILGEADDNPGLATNLLRVVDEIDRTEALARARGHLRQGGVVYMSPDGRQGALDLEVMVGRTRAVLGRGGPLLARLSGAVTVPAAGGWIGHRVHIDFAAPIVPAPGSSVAAWEADWTAAYVAWLAARLHGPAENIRVKQGIFRRAHRPSASPRSSPAASA